MSLKEWILNLGSVGIAQRLVFKLEKSKLYSKDFIFLMWVFVKF
jgi:hypothetical protein